MSGHKTRAVFDRDDIASPTDLLAAAEKLDQTASAGEKGSVKRTANGERFSRNRPDTVTAGTSDMGNHGWKGSPSACPQDQAR